MKLKTTLIVTTALVVLAGPALAQNQTLNLLDWGGAYGESHQVAYNRPFEQETGIRVVVSDADNPATPIKAMVEAGNVTADVASVEYADAVRMCDEGLLEEIDMSILRPGANGETAEEDFIDGALTVMIEPSEREGIWQPVDREIAKHYGDTKVFAEGCADFTPDVEEEQTGKGGCYDCLYRRWTEKGILCQKPQEDA